MQNTNSFRTRKIHFVGLSAILTAVVVLHQWNKARLTHQRDQTELGQKILQNSLDQLFEAVSRHTVALYRSDIDGYCNGVIVHKQMILTAAHCLENLHEPIEIRFGQDSLNRYTSIFSSRFFMHADFEGSEQSTQVGVDTHDYALIQVNEPLPPPYNEIPLFDSRIPLPKVTPLLYATYGKIESAPPVQHRRFRSGVLFLLDPNFSSTEFSLQPQKENSLCRGDSGAPIFHLHQGKLWLLGLISRGNHDCTFSVAVYPRDLETMIRSLTSP